MHVVIGASNVHTIRDTKVAADFAITPQTMHPAAAGQPSSALLQKIDIFLSG